MNENEKGPAIIEIQTLEGGRITWVGIYSDSDRSRAVQWGERLLHGVYPKPNLRITAGLYGPVIGAWQDEGYEGVSA